MIALPFLNRWYPVHKRSGQTVKQDQRKQKPYTQQMLQCCVGFGSRTPALAERRAHSFSTLARSATTLQCLDSAIAESYLANFSEDGSVLKLHESLAVILRAH